MTFSIRDLNKNKSDGTGIAGGQIRIEPQPEPELRDPMAGLSHAHSLTGSAPTDREWRAYADLWTEGYFGPEWQEKFNDNFPTERNHFRRVIEPVLMDLATRENRAREASRIQREQEERNSQTERLDKIKLPCCGSYSDAQRVHFNRELGFYLACGKCSTRNKI